MESGMQQSSNTIVEGGKKGKKVCSCLDVIKRAFQRQQAINNDFMNNQSQKGENTLTHLQLNKNGESHGVITTYTINHTNVGDLTTNMFMNRQNSQTYNALLVKDGQKVGDGPALQMNYNGTFIQNQNPNQGNFETNSNNQEDYVFRFMQRYDYMSKKFAPKQELKLNKNCRSFLNFIMKTILEGGEVEYCEGIDTNYFLLKYFKFECMICTRLCSHALITDCCKNSICLECCNEIANEYEKINTRITECLICHKDLSKSYYLFRDPYKNEEKQIVRKTVESLKQRFQEKESSKLGQNLNEDSIILSDSKVNQSFSAVKPVKLTFQDRFSLLQQTAQKMKKQLDYLNESFSKKDRMELHNINNGLLGSGYGKMAGASTGLCKDRVSLLFEDILQASNSRHSSPKSGTESPVLTQGTTRQQEGNGSSSGDSKTVKDYSTNIYLSNIQNQSAINNLLNHTTQININTTNVNTTNMNNNNSRYVIGNDEELSARVVTQEEEQKPHIPPFKQIGGRKRIQNNNQRVKQGAVYNNIKKQNLNNSDDLSTQSFQFQTNGQLIFGKEKGRAAVDLENQSMDDIVSSSSARSIKKDNQPISKRLRSRKAVANMGATGVNVEDKENVNEINISRGSTKRNSSQGPSLQATDIIQQSKRIRKA